MPDIFALRKETVMKILADFATLSLLVVLILAPKIIETFVILKNQED